MHKTKLKTTVDSLNLSLNLDLYSFELSLVHNNHSEYQLDIIKQG